MICEQIGTADFYAGNESPQQYIPTSMQNSHDTLIFLDKHKLQFRLKVHNIAALQKQGETSPTDAQITPQAHDSASSQLYSPEAALSA